MNDISIVTEMRLMFIKLFAKTNAIYLVWILLLSVCEASDQDLCCVPGAMGHIL